MIRSAIFFILLMIFILLCKIYTEISSRVAEHHCYLESLDQEVEINETVYCKNFKIKRISHNKFVVEIKPQDGFSS